MIRTVDIYDTSMIGVFATCTEDVVLVPTGTKPETCAILEDSLDARVVETLVNGSVVIGALSRGNSNGFLFSYGTDAREMKELTGVEAEILPGKLNAVGNIVLANDSAALVHPELSDRAIETIANTLKVEVYRGTIAGIKNVGMAGVVTNKGLLVHPKVTASEIETLEKIFELPVNIGTTNFGTQMLGSGLLANSKNYLAGSDTTGPELGRIEEALGFLEQYYNPPVSQKVAARVVTKMKSFIVKGKFKAGNSWEKFTKQVESQNEKNATDKVYSVFVSKHGIKRSQIQIESIAEE